MKIFVTGATGYIGGSVADRLIKAGHQVVGLVRSTEGAAKLAGRGIEPRAGSLDDDEVVAAEARQADAVINAASSDHARVVSTILEALAGTSKTFVQTSGSSIVGDKAMGEPGGRIYHDDTPLTPLPEKAGRVAIDRSVLAAADRGVRSVVLCPCLIYGEGRGVHRESIQVPWLIELAKREGVPRHVGRGENIWSHVHIDDVADAYHLALEHAGAGSFFFLENGEASYRSVAESIGRMLDQGERTEPLAIDEAIQIWGAEAAHFAFGSNSRVRSEKARTLLGWRPSGPALFDEIERGYYRRVHAHI